MLKKITFILVLFLLSATVSKAQWESKGAWPNANYKGGTHGIEIAPDGKIWTASYYKSTWVTPTKTFTNVSPIVVFSADGSKVDTIFTVTTGGVTDTLGIGGSTSGTRGIAKDELGNIIFISSGPSKMIKIDYKTYQGIARYVFGSTDIGTSPAGPSVTSDGTVFVGPVVGNKGADKKIAMFTKNFALLGTAVAGPPAIVRTFKVSKDGLTIYWTPFTGTHGIFIYKRASDFDSFALTDSLLKGMSVESAAFDPITGLFWVSNDKRSETLAPLKYGHLRWYGVNLTTKQIVDSLTLASPDPTPLDELPRGLAFSADGKTIYVGLFGIKYDRIFKFTKGTSGVKQLDELPVGYELSQNYPNPFNPTTNIKFSIPKEGFVSLKIFNTLGQEVATLVNEVKSAGTYQVDFDASNLSTGMYVYRLSSGSYNVSKKMLLMK